MTISRIDKLTDRLLSKGIPVASVTSKGDILYRSTLTDDQREQVQQIISLHLENPDAPVSWDEVRETRNALLYASDWTQLPDSPLTDEGKQLWRDYRSKLRDIPSNFSDPWDVEWPDTP